MRALGAVRLSAYKDESTSPERQRDVIERTADQRALTIVDWAEDLDISASKYPPQNRPSLGPWLLDRTDEYDAIIWWRLDRAVRSMRDLSWLGTWAKDHGKRLLFASGPGGSALELDMSSPVSELIALVLAFAAQMEALAIQERTADAARAMRRMGRWAGGDVPYGYQAVKIPDRKGWWLAREPDAESVIFDMIERVIGGESLNSIAANLNSLHIPTPKLHASKLRGKDRAQHKPDSVRPFSWTANSIKAVLRGRAILGQKEYKGSVIKGDDGNPIQFGEPIVSYSKWREVADILESKTRGAGRTKNASLLLDIAFCSLCEGKLYIAYSGGDKASYRCSSWLRRRECESYSIPAEWLESQVLEMILLEIGTQQFTEKVYIGGTDNSERVQEIADILAELRAERAQGLYRGERGKSEYAQMYSKLEAEREELEAVPAVSAHYEYRPTGQTVQQALSDARTAPERRQVMLGLGLRVLAAKDRLRLEVPGLADQGAMRIEEGKLKGHPKMPPS